MAVTGSQALKKFIFQTAPWRQLGLLYDDILYESPPVAEAVRRLPENVKNDRTYRILRAMQLSLMHRVLPKEQWTKFEDNVHYLQPYIDGVEKEIKEKQDWEKNH